MAVVKKFLAAVSSLQAVPVMVTERVLHLKSHVPQGTCEVIPKNRLLELLGSRAGRAVQMMSPQVLQTAGAEESDLDRAEAT